MVFVISTPALITVHSYAANSNAMHTKRAKSAFWRGQHSQNRKKHAILLRGIVPCEQ
jgi:hypothetical protein